MLDIHKPPPSTDTKTAFSHSLLPTYIDALHPPCKKLPFRAFKSLPHTHTLDLILPAEIWGIVAAYLEEKKLASQVYARVWLKLEDVLDEQFLDAYVRTGGASMLASPSPSSVAGDAGRDYDTDMRIVDGVLTLHMSRAVYERAGLVGRAVEDGGKKHSRARWEIEVDLKSPSMRKGKKGFERLRWAAREVLNGSRRWLFASAHPQFEENLNEAREMLSSHAPEVVVLKPRVEEVKRVRVPKFDVCDNGVSALREEEDALALLEWLDLVALGSPRVKNDDPIDSLLSRYEVPSFTSSSDALAPRSLVRVRWSGFLTPLLIQELFLAVWNVGFKSKRDAKRRKDTEDGDVVMEGAQDKGVDGEEEKWFSLSAQAFGGRGAWTLMQFAATRETLVWEVEG